MKRWLVFKYRVTLPLVLWNAYLAIGAAWVLGNGDERVLSAVVVIVASVATLWHLVRVDQESS